VALQLALPSQASQAGLDLTVGAHTGAHHEFRRRMPAPRSSRRRRKPRCRCSLDRRNERLVEKSALAKVWRCGPL
jgi:hypothetical protein